VTFDPIQNASDQLALDRGCYFDEAQGNRPIEFIERFCRQSKARTGNAMLTSVIRPGKLRGSVKRDAFGLGQLP